MAERIGRAEPPLGESLLHFPFGMLAGETYPIRMRVLWVGKCTLPMFGSRRSLAGDHCGEGGARHRSSGAVLCPQRPRILTVTPVE